MVGFFFLLNLLAVAFKCPPSFVGPLKGTCGNGGWLSATAAQLARLVVIGVTT